MILPDGFPPNFAAFEFEHSETARREGIDNTIPPEVLPEVRALAWFVLQPVRDVAGQLEITNGYRAPALTVALAAAGYNPSPTSDHPKGRAADVVAFEISQLELWAIVVALVRGGLPCDQAILYPERGHIHLSWRPAPRRALLVSDSRGTRAWTPDPEPDTPAGPVEAPNELDPTTGADPAPAAAATPQEQTQTEKTMADTGVPHVHPIAGLASFFLAIQNGDLTRDEFVEIADDALDLGPLDVLVPTTAGILYDASLPFVQRFDFDKMTRRRTPAELRDEADEAAADGRDKKAARLRKRADKREAADLAAASA